MLRFIAHQVTHRRSRSAYLALGIVVATVSFTLLTSEASTTELRVRGSIARSWRPAYDILVRPPGTFTAIEKADGLVAANHLSGIFGGITAAQWRRIQGIPGVEVAAPVENIGYILPFQSVPISVAPYLSDAPVQILRIRETRTANGGLSTYPGRTSYVYVTRAHRFVDVSGEPREVVPGRSQPLAVCDGFDTGRPLSPRSPFDLRFQSELFCYSSRSSSSQEVGNAPSRDFVGALTDLSFPLLVAAVDPLEEEKLVGLDRTLTSGRGLREGDGPLVVPGAGANGTASTQIPTIASTRTFVDETVSAAVERLVIPEGIDVPATLASTGAWAFLDELKGTALRPETLDLQSIYDRMLSEASGDQGLATFESYRQTSPVKYRRLPGGRLAPTPINNPASVWQSVLFDTFLTPPAENDDVQFRALRAYAAATSLSSGVDTRPRLRVVGRFDPELLPAFRSSSAVPLETYFPPTVDVADGTIPAAPAGRQLGPTMNIGGYIAQPPMLLTTLQGARPFLDSRIFPGANPTAPISVIRVRVAGVKGPDPVSRERVRRVAQEIHLRTGLGVDITAGSSATVIEVQLPEGKGGQPPLLIHERWVKKGVAVVILEALDRKSLALFVLVLVVAALFLANASFAAVRSRRIEIGTVRSLGWPRRAVVEAALGEAVLIGLAAGMVGAALGAGLAWLLHLSIPLARTLLVVPAAPALAMVAALPPAWAATRTLPFDEANAGAVGRATGRTSQTMFRLALANLGRVPARSVLASIGVLVGVAATSLLLAIQLAFNGALVGTALGAFVSIQVRTVDFISVVVITLMAALCVADVLFLNMRERAPELAALRAVGWREADLRHLVELEGAVLGIVGSVAGAALGVGLALLVGGPLVVLLTAAAIAAAAGTGVVVLASVIPALRVARLAPTATLVEE